ncbi:hypothetical protein AVEN_48653-1 [Araneus ventricosus]|uniref:Uncharacterized protein n=1 Tax=Araneus ventricosus TaxID=182803 RepID=A0A4Y2TKN7_ARAVE|nr:hypothetical protein AVEN_48653-1 [Araneus ventricosus]
MQFISSSPTCDVDRAGTNKSKVRAQHKEAERTDTAQRSQTYGHSTKKPNVRTQHKEAEGTGAEQRSRTYGQKEAERKTPTNKGLSGNIVEVT